MAGVGQIGQARTRDQRLQARCGVRRDPAVFGAPQDLGRRLDARIERLQVAGEIVVVLRDLTVIGGLADRAASIPFMESVAGREARSINMTDILNVIDATPPSVSAAEVPRYQSFEDTGR